MYIPIIKTTAAEIRGFDNLSDDVKNSLLPLFELTKDRKHKKLYPEGRLEEALKKALDAQPIGKLILDLTAHDDLINSQIEALFDSTEGYSKWCSFIKDTNCTDRIIPTVQIELDDDLATAKQDVENQVKTLESLCGQVALRSDLDIEDNELAEIVSWIINSLSSPDKLILIIDCGYIKPHTSSLYAKEVIRRVECILSSVQCELKIAVSSSSFPKSVIAPHYGRDHEGHFDLEEVALHEELSSEKPNVNWIYSDYALIHPVRYNVRGGSWIPRVDVPLEKEVFYFRYRRGEEGGYKTAVKEAVNYSHYGDTKDCWGKTQIELAAGGDLEKRRSPSFWISVRSNIHIKTQAVRTSTTSG